MTTFVGSSDDSNDDSDVDPLSDHSNDDNPPKMRRKSAKITSLNNNANPIIIKSLQPIPKMSFDEKLDELSYDFDNYSDINIDNESYMDIKTDNDNIESAFEEQNYSIYNIHDNNIVFYPKQLQVVNALKIKITHMEERVNSYSKYHVYCVVHEPSIIPNKDIKVLRRYNDFKWLFNYYKSIYPGLFIPALPEPKIFGRYEKKFINERAYDLERFLNRLGNCKPFADHDAFKFFLTKPEDVFFLTKKQFSKDINSNDYEATFDRLSEICKDIVFDERKESNDEYYIENNDCNELLKYLKEVSLKLRNMYNSAQKLYISLAKVTFQAKVMKNAFFTLSTELNKSILDILPFPNTKQLEPIHTHHEQTRQTFKRNIVRNLRYDYSDTNCLIDILKEREKLYQKYMNQKFINDKWEYYKNQGANISEWQQQQINIWNNEQKNMEKLIILMTKLILNNEIKMIFNFKTKQWLFNISQLSKQLFNAHLILIKEYK